MSKETMTTHTDYPKPELTPLITMLLPTKEWQQLQAYVDAMVAWAREQALEEAAKYFDAKGFIEDHGSNFADEIRRMK